MRHFAQRLTPREFFGRITATRFAIVLVESGPMANFAPGIIDAFDDRYPKQFSYGTLDKSRVPGSEWWEENFRTAFGPMSRNREPETGYYLFEIGAVRAHRRPSPGLDDAALAKQIVETFDERVRLSGWRDEPRTAREAQVPISPHVASGEDPFVVLGLKLDASDEEIKKAYRDAMKANHPDRVANLSPAIKKVAEDETRRIQAAYEAIRGMRKGSAL